jgi:hypothetical protein
MDTTCGFGNGRGELNLGFGEDVAMRESLGMSLDGYPPCNCSSMDMKASLPVSA